MDEEFQKIINTNIGSIENLIDHLKLFIINEYNKNKDLFTNGTINYIDYRIPSGYISKYTHLECYNIIKNFLEKNNRKQFENNIDCSTNVNYILNKLWLKENEFMPYRLEYINMKKDKIKVMDKYGTSVIGFIIPIIKDDLLEHKIIKLESVEIL